MKYNDGFVAYINGQEVARRNAPVTPQWDSAATAARSVEDSLQYEEIDITDSLDVLQPGRNVLAIHGLNVERGGRQLPDRAEAVGGGHGGTLPIRRRGPPTARLSRAS